MSDNLPNIRTSTSVNSMNSQEFITSQRVDLSNCEQEAINITDRIQPHGVLVDLQKLH